MTKYTKQQIIEAIRKTPMMDKTGDRETVRLWELDMFSQFLDALPDPQLHTPNLNNFRRQYELLARNYFTTEVALDTAMGEYDLVIAAAEQRGAERGKAEGYDTALNEAASRGLISIDAHDLLNLNNPYRADRIADKEGE